MNKTVNINLGGMFFHIDEDAFQKLTRYFDAIKRSLSNSNGQDEIIRDIEMRIAELISEKHTSDNQVINLRELDEIIAIMGQPEDYRLEDEPTVESAPSFEEKRSTRKLYRDTDKGMIGGVATGLGHYFGIDAAWFKILFLAVVIFGFGSGIVAYIILWIVVPAAITTSEKLEMTGEPVTISNIERKVREEFDAMSEKFKNSDFKGARVDADRVARNVGGFVLTILNVFVKILGALIIVFTSVALASMIIGLFTFGSTTIVNLPGSQFLAAMNYTDQPLWLISLLGFGAFGIPLFALMLLGFKLLISNMRSIGSVAKYTLLALWILSVIGFIIIGIKQATEMAFDGKVTSKRELALQPTDTLSVKFRYNEFYANGIDDDPDYLFAKDETGKDIIYMTDVDFHIRRSADAKAYIQIEKVANGPSLIDAKERANKILYNYSIEGNQLILDNYYLTDLANKFRDQSVNIYLYLPNGMVFKPESSLQNFDESDDDFFNLHFSGDYIYKVEQNRVMCLDCPADENDHGDSATKITINENGVRVEQNDSLRTISKGLTLDANGIVIKTK
ncbi:MAG: PspC domain-containing protein [Flavobacterium sp.]|nr:PspC domain-containing protein [Flavobacterium sp.]